MKCKRCGVDSPFHWTERTEPSIFAQDQYFRAKNDAGQTAGQIVTEIREKNKAAGKPVSKLYNLENKRTAKEKVEQILAFKFFGTFTKAVAAKGKA
jgi:hypothetical protein